MHKKMSPEEVTSLLLEQSTDEVLREYVEQLNEPVRRLLEDQLIVEKKLNEINRYLPPVPKFTSPQARPSSGNNRRRFKQAPGVFLAAAAAVVLAMLTLPFGRETSDPNRSAEIAATARADLPPLHRAVAEGDMKTVTRLLQRSELLTATDQRGRTALMTAALEDRPAMMKLLIGKGLPLNEVDDAGRTALVLAAQLGNKRCLEVLLAAKADVNREDMRGFTALAYARKNHYDGCVALLQQFGAR